MDTFTIDYAKAVELKDKLDQQLLEVTQFRKKNPGESTARFEYTMRSSSQSLQTNIRNLERLASEY